MNQADDKDIILMSDNGSGGDTAYITLDGSESSIVISKNTFHADNVATYFGSSNDMYIRHDGTNNQILSSTGNLDFEQHADDGNIRFYNDNGSGGVTLYFYLDGAGAATNDYYTVFQDYVRAAFGTGKDLKIWHDATSSYIRNETGSLYLMSAADDNDMYFQCDDGAGGLRNYFYFDGSMAASGGLCYTIFPDNSVLSIGDSSDLKISHQSGHSYIENGTGVLNITNSGGDLNFDVSADIILDADGGDIKLKDGGTARHTISMQANGDTYFVNETADADIMIRGVDGSSTITALTLDMSNAGSATFNDDVDVNGNIYVGVGTEAGMVGITYSDISTGENRGLRIINTSGTDQQWNITAGITGQENESFCIRDATANVNALTMAISSGNATFAGTITSTKALTSGYINEHINTSNHSNAYASMKWKNDDAGFGEIWRNSSARSSTGQGVKSFNMYNSNDINFWSGSTHTLLLSGNDATFAGNVILENASSPKIELKDTTNNCYLYMYAQDSNAIMGTYSNHALKLFSNSTEALEFDTSQNATFAGMITTGDAGNSFYATGYRRSGSGTDTVPDIWGDSNNLVLGYDSNNYGIAIRDEGVVVNDTLVLQSGSPEMYFYSTGNHHNWMVAAQENVDTCLEFSVTGSTSTSLDYDASNYTRILTLYQNGNATLAGTFTASGDVVAYSDERLKTDIKTLDGSKVYEMRGVGFTKDDKKGSGVIAQELEKIAPELVNNDSEYKAVAYGNITGYLIEAIKDLKAEIEELKKCNKCNDCDCK